MRNILLSLFVILAFSACNGSAATDAGIDAIVSVDVAQDSGPIGPDVVSIDAVDALDADR